MKPAKEDPAAGARLGLLIAAIDYGADLKAKAKTTALARSRDALLHAAKTYYRKSMPGLRSALRTATKGKGGR